MRKILGIYFKPNSLDAFILISFKELKGFKTVKINEIHFFKNEIDIIDFNNQENLELLKETNSTTRGAIKSLINLINRYLSGGKFNLIDKINELNIELDLKDKFPTNFSESVMKNLINLKYGEVTTYSKIGNKIGSKAFRAIGTVCKSNPLPLIIPCHRVIRKNGEIGGFMGKLDETWESNLKKQLLKIEGYKI